MTNYASIHEGFDVHKEYFYYGYTDIFEELSIFCKVSCVKLVGVVEEKGVSSFLTGLK
jgi:hypothetical protein